MNFSSVDQIDALHEKCIYVGYVCIQADAITAIYYWDYEYSNVFNIPNIKDSVSEV